MGENKWLWLHLRKHWSAYCSMAFTVNTVHVKYYRENPNNTCFPWLVLPSLFNNSLLYMSTTDWFISYSVVLCSCIKSIWWLLLLSLVEKGYLLWIILKLTIKMVNGSHDHWCRDIRQTGRSPPAHAPPTGTAGMCTTPVSQGGWYGIHIHTGLIMNMMNSLICT